MFNLIPYRSNANTPANAATGSLFDDSFFRSFFGNDLWETSSFRVDVKETKDQYLLHAELPGVPSDRIELTAHDGMLTISADTSSETSEENETYIFRERRSGHCQRSFSLDGIDEEKITAKHENGILTVTLPKLTSTPEKNVRKIDIR